MFRPLIVFLFIIQSCGAYAASGSTPRIDRVESYSIGNVRASEGTGTTTLTSSDARHQVFNLSAARTVVLPSATLKGELWILRNVGLFDLTIQSSNTNTIEIINKGLIKCRALIDNPTALAHWDIEYVVGSTTGIDPSQNLVGSRLCYTSSGIVCSSSGTVVAIDATPPAGTYFITSAMIVTTTSGSPALGFGKISTTSSDVGTEYTDRMSVFNLANAGSYIAQNNLRLSYYLSVNGSQHVYLNCGVLMATSMTISSQMCFYRTR